MPGTQGRWVSLELARKALALRAEGAAWVIIEDRLGHSTRGLRDAIALLEAVEAARADVESAA
jgi:hypothetical protein